MPSRLSITVVKHSDEDVRILFCIFDADGRVSSKIDRLKFNNCVEALDYLYCELEKCQERFF